MHQIDCPVYRLNFSVSLCIFEFEFARVLAFRKSCFTLLKNHSCLHGKNMEYNEVQEAVSADIQCHMTLEKAI